MKIENNQLLNDIRNFTQGYFQVPEDLDGFLEDYMGQRLNTFVTGMPSYPHMIRIVVRDLNSGGTILRYLQRLHDHAKGSIREPEVKEFLDRARALDSVMGNGVDDVYQRCFAGPFPFANHSRLRDAVKKLADTDQGLLVVSGPALSGKSYSRHFISRVVKFVGAGAPIIADITELGGEPDASIPKWFDLAAMSLTADSTSAQDQLDRYAQKPRNGDHLGTWFFVELNNREGVTWVIIDNVSDAIDDGVADETSQAIIRRLAKSAFENNSGSAKIILLCSSTDWLPADILNWHEPVELDCLSADDLIKYFEDFAKEYDLSCDYDDDELAEAASRLIRNYGSDSNEPDRLAPTLKQFVLDAYPGAEEKLGL